jgi:glycosyltransferase involved in cell wall biosynthesis
MSSAASTVTVVVPTLGTSPYLREAVTSALADEPAEVIVVADGGGVGADDVPGARVLELGRVGRSRARNAGVEAARTELVAFLDDDDAVLPGRLERQESAIRSRSDAALAFGRVRIVDGQGRPADDWNALLEKRFGRLVARGADYAAILATDCPIYTSATIVRRDRFLAAGGFDPGFDAYEDLDLYLRLARDHALVATPGGAVTVYRLHGRNTPSERLYAGSLAAVEKHLPGARGEARRLLLERRVEALWGLGRFSLARKSALAAALAEPLLLAHPRFAKRFAASLIPLRLLETRRG